MLARAVVHNQRTKLAKFAVRNEASAICCELTVLNCTISWKVRVVVLSVPLVTRSGQGLLLIRAVSVCDGDADEKHGKVSR